MHTCLGETRRGNVPYGEIMGQIRERRGILAPNERQCWDNSFRALKKIKTMGSGGR